MIINSLRFLFIQQMHQAHHHHARRHFVSFRADHRLDVLEIGARCGFLIFLTNPGVDIKVEATNRRVSRRILLVMQVWLAWEIALELHPIEALHALLSVGLDERVQFAIGDIVQILSVGPDVAHRFR
jgi:hypothetical protein